MAMVFCRGCGKEVHESASTCPHCGFKYSVQTWASVTSFVLAVLVLMTWADYPNWDKEVTAGVYGFSLASALFAAVARHQKQGAPALYWIGWVISGVTLVTLLL